jgi:hypothetical protein
MTIKNHSVADYSNENPNKILNSYSLIEAIHEHLDPTAPHDTEYLSMRINLLRDVFEIGLDSNNANAIAITQLVSGYGQVKPIRVLPFEGAWEVPDSIDTEAHFKIEKQFEESLSEIRKRTYEIQRAYITYVIIHAVDGRLRAKTVYLSDLIAAGLPQSDPGYDLLDDW